MTYHLERSADLVAKLGDGTLESHNRMQDALDLLWPYVGELFLADEVDEEAARNGYGPELNDIRPSFDELTGQVFRAGLLKMPEVPTRTGGKVGLHSEAFGYMLTEMQVLQRTHPGAKW